MLLDTPVVAPVGQEPAADRKPGFRKDLAITIGGLGGCGGESGGKQAEQQNLTKRKQTRPKKEFLSNKFAP